LVIQKLTFSSVPFVIILFLVYAIALEELLGAPLGFGGTAFSIRRYTDVQQVTAIGDQQYPFFRPIATIQDLVAALKQNSLVLDATLPQVVAGKKRRIEAKLKN
jgi:hypothetical protein